MCLNTATVNLLLRLNMAIKLFISCIFFSKHKQFIAILNSKSTHESPLPVSSILSYLPPRSFRPHYPLFSPSPPPLAPPLLCHPHPCSPLSPPLPPHPLLLYTWALTEEVAKLKKHLALLRQEYVKMQQKLADTERRYAMLAAQATSQGATSPNAPASGDTFISRLLEIVCELYQQEQYR